jgi:predicted nucleic acid-binding Zn ribbon protein
MRDLIDGLSHAGGWAERLVLGKLRGLWPEVAGPVVAGHSEPASLAGGVLTIRADSGVWATELTLLSHQLLARTERALGPGFVGEIRVVAAPSGPARTRS